MQTTAEDVKGEVVAAVAALARAVAGGLTQEEAGELFGVNNSTVSRWLAGARLPSGEARRAILQWHRQGKAGHEPDATPDYWRGVYYAAEAMSATITTLLRQAREASEAGTVAASVEATLAAHVAAGTRAAAAPAPAARRQQRRG